ncbi:MAG TPA: hypothetical protein VE825_01175 [Terriglobales bacterium]|nr:hypothetical protein [Terriglobales bacterium]
MRWSGWLAALVFLCGACVAQMPPRAELIQNPKFLESVPQTFQAFTESQLRAEIHIVSARSYAMFGYNTPEVQVKLPRVSNSAYSTIDFSDPTPVNEAGGHVKFEQERGGYNEEKFSDEIRFRIPDSDQIVRFAHARGSVKVKYPLAVKTITVTPSQPGPKELALKIDGPFVSFAPDAVQVPDTSFTKLKPVRAYDAQGHLLEPYSYSETGTDDDGVERTKMAFYGNVARLEIDSVENWAELDLPYDLAPAPLLPAGHEGEDPERPQQ